MDNVQNKNAIVTGAGAGIGYHITEELLRKGAKKVAIIDLPIARSYEATVTLQEKFGKDRVIFFPIDLTNMEVYNETFKQIVEALNGLDILVNNAGIFNDRCIEQTFAINVVALIRGSMLGIDYMGKHKGGKGGTILNMASVAGVTNISTDFLPVYSSSKYAVIGFSINIEKFYYKTGVRILTMCPHFTLTEMIRTNLSGRSRFLDIVDQDLLDKFDQNFLKPQSVEHVGQSTVMVIQKGKNGSIWIVQNNEPPFQIKLQPYIAA